MTKKKWLQNKLEDAYIDLNQEVQRNSDLTKELIRVREEASVLKAEKRNREIAGRIAYAIGSWVVYAINVTFESRGFDEYTAVIELTGTGTSIYNLGMEFNKGF